MHFTFLYWFFLGLRTNSHFCRISTNPADALADEELIPSRFLHVASSFSGKRMVFLPAFNCFLALCPIPSLLYLSFLKSAVFLLHSHSPASSKPNTTAHPHPARNLPAEPGLQPDGPPIVQLDIHWMHVIPKGAMEGNGERPLTSHPSRSTGNSAGHAGLATRPSHPVLWHP